MTRFAWAVVTAVAPLRIKIVGDVDPLDDTPTTLVAGLAVGDVVRVELDGRDRIIHGRRLP